MSSTAPAPAKTAKEIDTSAIIPLESATREAWLKNLEELPGVQEKWESENMMRRLGKPEEFKSAGLFLLSRASSFMTGNNLVSMPSLKLQGWLY